MFLAYFAVTNISYSVCFKLSVNAVLVNKNKRRSYPDNTLRRAIVFLLLYTVDIFISKVIKNSKNTC
jgi:hypothetical protein